MTWLWTAGDVEDSVLDAMDTLMCLPRVGGPSSYGNNWPDYALDYRERRIRVLPSASDVSRMETVFAWVNAIPEESHRLLVYKWAVAKVRRGKSVKNLAEEEGIKSRTLRWTVTRIFQGVADMLNAQAKKPCEDPEIDAIAEKLVHETADSVPQPRPLKTPRYVRDAKPVGDTSPEGIKDTERLIRKIRKRMRKRRRQNHPKNR